MTKTHGMSKTKTYNSWRAMKERVSNPKNKHYRNYGDRGITYDNKWNSFENFYKDMGERPECMTLDRIDNNGNYTKKNCRWATQREQSNNTRENIMLEYKGVKLSATQWERKLGYRAGLIRERFNYGWDIDRIFKEEKEIERFLDCCGKRLSIKQWANKYGNTKSRILDRINSLGWSIEKAIKTPKQ